MKLKYIFECMELDDHTVAVPVGDNAHDFQGVIKLNESAVEIFDLLREREEISEEDIVNALEKKYGSQPEISSYVHEVIEYLISEGVLE